MVTILLEIATRTELNHERYLFIYKSFTEQLPFNVRDYYVIIDCTYFIVYLTVNNKYRIKSTIVVSFFLWKFHTGREQEIKC